MKALFALLFFCSFPAFANDQLVLDPAHVECKLEKPRGFPETNVYYQGLIIHRGRETSADLASGDFIFCQNTVQDALSAGQYLIMNRGYAGDTDVFDWGVDGFFFIQGS